MTQTKIEAAKQTLAAYEGHKKALTAIQRMAGILEADKGSGLRIKVNHKSGDGPEIVMAEDLGPAFEEGLVDALLTAIEFHKEAIEELEADGPQADPQTGPITQ